MDLSQLALALQAYKADKGQYPAKLDELRGAYFKEVPQDRFNGQPLIYKPSAKGYLLYSVGPNMKDDGGKEQKDATGDDYDIVVKVE